MPPGDGALKGPNGASTRSSRRSPAVTTGSVRHRHQGPTQRRASAGPPHQMPFSPVPRAFRPALPLSARKPSRARPRLHGELRVAGASQMPRCCKQQSSHATAGDRAAACGQRPRRGHCQRRIHARDQRRCRLPHHARRAFRARAGVRGCRRLRGCLCPERDRQPDRSPIAHARDQLARGAGLCAAQFPTHSWRGWCSGVGK